MPEMRPGHEGRTDLYEGAKTQSKSYWFEHPGMPQRPTGLHATTVSDSPMGALENLRGEAAGAEGTDRLQDGHHMVRLMEHDPSKGGDAQHIYSISHTVEQGKTAAGRGGFIPNMGNAHHDNVIKG